jgi:hypothetical protein
MGQLKGQAFNPNDQTKTTHREITENNSNNGQIQTIMKKGKTYNLNETAKPTHRETTEQTNFVGQISHPTKTKQIVYNPNNVAKTTHRETTEQTDFVGVVSHPSATKQIVYDPNDSMKTTHRETIEQNDFVGAVSNSSKTKQIVYDPYDFTRTTHRETIEQNDYVTTPDAGYLQNGFGYQTAPLDVKNTQRQFQCDLYYTGGAGQAEAPANQQLYDSAYNMRQNYNKEIVAEGRYPTLSNVKLNSGKESVNIEIKKLDDDRQSHYSVMPAPTFPNGRKPMSKCEITSYKNNLPTHNTYFDPSLLSAYNQNPLTQSLHSWA